MIKLTKKLLVLLIVSIVVFSFVTATTYAASTTIDEKNTGIIKIDSKEKAVGYKLTWKANGGKIGIKKTMTTTVKKGSKIGKLPSTPKRTGYTFTGWYTKKSGGTKINANTKPKRSVTLHAHWKKGSSNGLTSEEKKLIGSWSALITKPRIKAGGGLTFDTEQYWYFFNKDGTFNYTQVAYYGSYKLSGKYKVSNGKITFANSIKYDANNVKTGGFPNTVTEYRFEKDKSSTVLKIPTLHSSDLRYRTLLNALSFKS
ncbi:MAG: InlB B-repeat-containing protein [Methanobrevibacter sp.]|nr:InlB B-repeat-containing protein [Methanobrevibacter sp.]